MEEPLSICINTQTPLVQLLSPWPATSRQRRVAKELDLDRLKEGQDYRLSPGGVTRMVLPLVERLRSRGTLGKAHWVALNPNAPPKMRYHDLALHNVSIGRARMLGYGVVKEAIWRLAHGLRTPGRPSDLLWTDDFSEYAYYNRSTAELLRRLDRKYDFHLFYIHDFQQLQVGAMLGGLKPKLFRWHIPFGPTTVPPEWGATFEEYLSHYDTVVVSTDRYRSALRDFGYQGDTRRLYPYVDPKEYGYPSPPEIASRCAALGLRPEDEVGLLVARMDPAKGQDRAIRAFARIARKFPRLKLVLVGNGSFSGAKGGLALSKSAQWRSELELLVHRLGLDARVLFTGHVTQETLDALYERSLFTVLPSSKEGFGLVVVESWLHRRPTLVSREAGITEIIRSGRNGLTFDPADEVTLAAQIETLLNDPELRSMMGDEGYRTSSLCSLDNAAIEESKLMEELAEA
ncbi:MAG: glycosyltransferase family 4 protein [Euryarchaeota archaeon]|nr:glycosyltransferase family 4 protein [Euryarchaeota archaeon]MDE2044861.1 glycosyltransferase family 4 protein [Thermoplasmata archaeon]